MVPFKTSKLSVKHVDLKACTTALGGSVSIVDHKRSTKNNEKYTKVNVPLSVARQFIKFYGVRRYIKPVPAALVYYDNHVVAVERHPGGSTGSGTSTDAAKHQGWNPMVTYNITNHLKPRIKHGSWYTDGLFAFRLDRTRDSYNLSSDGRFKATIVEAIKLSDLFLAEGLTEETRSCLKYVASNGNSAMSPPIWKNLDRVGVRQLNRANAGDDDLDDADDEYSPELSGQSDDYQFDRIDQHLAVNLSFVLKAGRELADIFGYDAIEPLRLDKLMVQLNTVNLPNVSKDVKQTYDTGLPFTHAIAWLLGMLNKVDTMDSHLVIRSLLKHLTTKGVYRKNAFTPSAVYHKYMSNEHGGVPLMTREQAQADDDKQLSFDQLAARRRVLEGANSDGQPGVFTSMHADD